MPTLRPIRRLALAAAALAALISCGGGGGGGSGTITLRYQTSLTSAQRKAFEDAAGRLEKIITGGLTDVSVQDQAGNAMPCGSGTGSVDIKETVHGLLILVTVADLGASGLLAQSGPCIERKSNHLPVVATMTLNSNSSINWGSRFGAVVQHEMFHALGFGTIWPDLGLLSGSCTSDSTFTGPRALAGAEASNGAPSSWTSVPVENTGTCGGGTRDAHWRESVFDNELMTGFINGATQPLSRTTIESMADLGYTVDPLQADAFTIPFPNAAELEPGAEPPLNLGDDVVHTPPVQVAD